MQEGPFGLPPLLQVALQAVEHPAEEPGEETGGQRFADAPGRLSHRQPAGLLVDLHHRPLGPEADRLAQQSGPADGDAVVEPQIRKVDGDGGAADGDDPSAHVLTLIW